MYNKRILSEALETEGDLPSPVSASRDYGSVPAVSVSEAEDSPISERGAGHEWPAEAGTVPLPPPPSLTTVTVEPNNFMMVLLMDAVMVGDMEI